MLLAVWHGPTELGTVHPASLARRVGEGAPVLLLGGRNWTVRDVDWRRRRVSVLPTAGGGRSRWCGAARALPASICGAAERIVAGLAPACRLSRRADERLGRLRDDLPFVDAETLPIVAGAGRGVVVWLFAGALASASVVRALAEAGFHVPRWDDLSVTVDAAEARAVGQALCGFDPTRAHPDLPDAVGCEVSPRTEADRDADGFRDPGTRWTPTRPMLDPAHPLAAGSVRVHCPATFAGGRP